MSGSSPAPYFVTANQPTQSNWPQHQPQLTAATFGHGGQNYGYALSSSSPIGQNQNQLSLLQRLKTDYQQQQQFRPPAMAQYQGVQFNQQQQSGVPRVPQNQQYQPRPAIVMGLGGMAQQPQTQPPGSRPLFPATNVMTLNDIMPSQQQQQHQLQQQLQQQQQNSFMNAMISQGANLATFPTQTIETNWQDSQPSQPYILQYPDASPYPTWSPIESSPTVTTITMPDAPTSAAQTVPAVVRKTVVESKARKAIQAKQNATKKDTAVEKKIKALKRVNVKKKIVEVEPDEEEFEEVEEEVDREENDDDAEVDEEAEEEEDEELEEEEEELDEDVPQRKLPPPNPPLVKIIIKMTPIIIGTITITTTVHTTLIIPIIHIIRIVIADIITHIIDHPFHLQPLARVNTVIHLKGCLCNLKRIV
ncbi:hypothetical protein HDU97_008615 [Phlyctochytrium planicorne]|nr:hypothetical protein HDU97_008615 [Phlyctochytrium planicorne]